MNGRLNRIGARAATMVFAVVLMAGGTPARAQSYAWTERTGSGSRMWYGMASSSDGTKLAAVVYGGYIYTSTDSGVTWTERTAAGSRDWTNIASSSDGTKLAAVAYGSYVYTSTDSGATWTERTSSGFRYWGGIACSSDGTKLAAGASYIHTSTDSGATWTQQTASGSRDWRDIAMSSDGTKLAATVYSGSGDHYIYTSTDSGVSWTERTGAGSRSWMAITSSSDGTKLVAGAYAEGSYIYTSTDSGATWTERTSAGSRQWESMACTPDGTTIVAACSQYIYVSTDSGATWTQQTAAGSHDFTCVACSSDATKLAAGVYMGYIHTAGPATAPTVTTTAVSSITTTTASSGGNVTSDGGATVSARGVCWSTSANPTTADSKTTDGSGTGVFTSSISGLSPATTYHVRAYATNSVGTSYGSDVEFTTSSTTTPTVTTTAVGSITTTTASSGGNVTSDGGATVTARGVCWSTSANPTTADSKTTDGSGTGVFTSSITGLSAATTYHVRAYATNSAGTGYGSDVEFTTDTTPTVTTTAVSSITTTTASSGGNVTSDGGDTVTARGVCWSTSADPTTADSKTTDGSGTGVFTSSITGLSPGTAYHVRAYATNSVGTGYGSDVEFTTSTTTPTVTTTAVSSITTTTASSGGNVTASGGATVTARGVCWSTSANPTTGDSKTTDGSGTGVFTSSITGLSPGTAYHVRAYATNSVGTSYGSDVEFTTSTTTPTVTTTAVSSITTTTASSGGNVTASGGATVIARGVCWSTSANPTTVDSKTTDGSGTGVFTSSITGLSPGTAYHVRGYATNSVGTSYGSDVEFTTSTTTPTVTTAAVSDITPTTATCGGDVTADGGAAVTARGVCWSTSVNPTVADSTTTDGAGLGVYASSITGLTRGLNYHARAYATNSVGTAYGDDVAFAPQPGGWVAGDGGDQGDDGEPEDGTDDDGDTVPPTDGADTTSTVADDSGEATVASESAGGTVSATVTGAEPGEAVSLTTAEDGTVDLIVGDLAEPRFTLAMSELGGDAAATVALAADGRIEVEIREGDGNGVRFILVDFPTGTNLAVALGDAWLFGSITNNHGATLPIDLEVSERYDTTVFAITYLPRSTATNRMRFTGLSDMVHIEATHESEGAIYTVQLVYESLAPAGADQADLRMVRLDPTTEEFAPAGTNDVGESEITQTLGDYGVDTTAKTVWAVTDTLGTFAVGVRDISEEQPGDGDGPDQGNPEDNDNGSDATSDDGSADADAADDTAADGAQADNDNAQPTIDDSDDGTDENEVIDEGRATGHGGSTGLCGAGALGLFPIALAWLGTVKAASRRPRPTASPDEPRRSGRLAGRQVARPSARERVPGRASPRLPRRES